MESSVNTLRVELLGVVGEGSYGMVHVARLLDESTLVTPRYVAIKIEHGEDNALEKEFLVMKFIEKHHNIIEYIEFSPNFSLVSEGAFEGKPYLALEYA